MKRLTPAQQKAVVQQWKRAAPALARARDEELAAWQYDPSVVDALLEIGARAPRREEEPNGLVEMQRWFIEFARRQGLLPAAVREEPAAYETKKLSTFARASLPPGPRLAIFCSRKCPGRLILDTYEFCQSLRDRRITVVSGFHSPMELECLRILLRSPHPVIWCLARGLFKRVPVNPVDCRQPVAEGRLAIVSPFADKIRATARTALVRNRVVADMAAAVVVAHAAPGSKMEAFCRELRAAGKPLYTFDRPANATLFQWGAKSVASMDLAVFAGR